MVVGVHDPAEERHQQRAAARHILFHIPDRTVAYQVQVWCDHQLVPGQVGFRMGKIHADVTPEEFRINGLHLRQQLQVAGDLAFPFQRPPAFPIEQNGGFGLYAAARQTVKLL